MNLGPYEFRLPGWLPILLTVCLLSLLMGLGVWQWGRAEFKEGLQEDFTERKAAEGLRMMLGSEKPKRFRKAMVTGAFLEMPGFLLDNRTHQGRVGYQALAPFRLQGGGEVVLINLGWVPQGATRQDLPRLHWPRGLLEVPVLVSYPPEKTIVYGDEEPVRPGKPIVLQTLRLKQFEDAVGESLLPFVLLLADEATFGYRRQWKPYYGITPAKHRAYAFQWFSLAFALFMIFLTVNTHKKSANP